MLWKQKCQLEDRLEEEGHDANDRTFLPIAVFIDEATMCPFGELQSATGITVTLVLTPTEKRTSLAFKVLLGACRCKAQLNDLVRLALVEPLLKMQHLSNNENALVVGDVVYQPILHYVCGDDPGMRSLVGQSGWIAMLSRYFEDSCGKYSRERNERPTVVPARQRTVRRSTNVKALFGALELLKDGMAQLQSLPLLKKTACVLKARFKGEGLRWPGFEGSTCTPLLDLDECRHDLFSMLMPCTLHLLHLGLCKRLWYWIGQLLGKEFRTILNLMMKEGVLPGLETSLRSEIWKPDGACVSRPGRFWKELTNHGVSLLVTSAAHASLASNARNFVDNCFRVVDLLQHTTALQNCLFTWTYAKSQVGEMEILVKAWKEEVMSVFGGLTQVNFNLPNFDNRTSSFCSILLQ